MLKHDFFFEHQMIFVSSDSEPEELETAAFHSQGTLAPNTMSDLNKEEWRQKECQLLGCVLKREKVSKAWH
jgi:hypothetical protein